MARSQARQAVAKAPDQAGFWRSAGQIEAKLGNSVQAAKDYLRAATIYQKRGDLASTLKLAHEVVALDPDSVQAHLLLGECKAELLEDIEAEYHLNQVLENQPGHPRATEVLKDVQYRLEYQKSLESSGAMIIDTLALIYKPR